VRARLDLGLEPGQPVLRAFRSRIPGAPVSDTREVNPGEVWEENAPDGAPASRGPSWVVSPTWFGSAAQYCCWVLRSAGDSTSPAASTSRLIS
jgi:hypothetical protein